MRPGMARTKAQKTNAVDAYTIPIGFQIENTEMRVRGGGGGGGGKKT